MSITITEALAEIKTINKRIAKKQEFIRQYLARQESLKDPLAKDGGSDQVIAREMQAMTDLQGRTVRLRRAVQKANDETMVTVNGITRSISEWIVWRRDVAPGHQQFLNSLRQNLSMVRAQAQNKGSNVVGAAVASVNTDLKPTDIIVNVDEGKLAREIEDMENVLGQLDGMFSLKNATVTIEEIE